MVQSAARIRSTRLALAGRLSALALLAAPLGFGLAGSPPAASPPDWNGVWVLTGTFMDTQDGTSVATPGRPGDDHDPPVSEPKLKGDYLRKYQAHQKAESEGHPADDTGADCIPQGMPRFWHGPYAFEIVQTRKQINIYQEWNEQTRRIYLDGRHQVPDADPSFNGHSIGEWRGRELIVDTIQIREDSGLGLGATHSDQIHITEKLSQTGPDNLLVQMTVTDPLALVEPWASEFHLHRKSGMEVEEYVCAENNRNKPDDKGNTQSGLAPK